CAAGGGLLAASAMVTSPRSLDVRSSALLALQDTDHLAAVLLREDVEAAHLVVAVALRTDAFADDVERHVGDSRRADDVEDELSRQRAVVLRRQLSGERRLGRDEGIVVDHGLLADDVAGAVDGQQLEAADRT